MIRRSSSKYDANSDSKKGHVTNNQGHHGKDPTYPIEDFNDILRNDYNRTDE